MTELVRGGRVVVGDGAPTALVMEATWSPGSIQVEVAVFICTSEGTVVADEDLLSQMSSNTVSPDRSVFLVQDYTGGINHRAQVLVDITTLPAAAEGIDVVLVTPEDGQTLQPVREVNMNLWDPADGQSLASFTLAQGVLCSCLVLGRLYKHNGQWKFLAVAEAYPKDFPSQVQEYGITVKTP